MLSYVLLIVIGMAIAGMVYGFLRCRAQLPDEEVCPEDTTLIIRDYSCNNAEKTIEIEVQNKGLFNVNGFFIRATNSTGISPNIPLKKYGVEGIEGRFDFGTLEEPEVLKPTDPSQLTKFSYLNHAPLLIVEIQPFIINYIVDIGISFQNIEYIVQMGIIYVILTVVMVVFNYIGLFRLTKISQKIVFSIRNEIFAQLQKCSMQYFDRRPSGEIVSISTNDVDQLNQLVGGQIAQIVTGFVSIIFYTIFMFIINYYLALLSLVIYPAFLLPSNQHHLK